ncbi:hypothetical protein Bca52824_004580 [Brassica carinata]|uniref:Serine-threonine/tyrosine-protein kinase catalytic domain-containing protein n=1 Tax=Brassica carinata TaxID=52824 RepID=A0A8X8BFT8_BRACI|nr:hypothetical protein Bca52824_004580 [Brassica carinata]
MAWSMLLVAYPVARLQRYCIPSQEELPELPQLEMRFGVPPETVPLHHRSSQENQSRLEEMTLVLPPSTELRHPFPPPKELRKPELMPGPCQSPEEAFINQLSSAGVRGSIGYAAPEYAMGGEISVHGDAYSFGILIFEMFSRKRPTDEMFGGDLTLRSCIRSALPEHVLDVADKLVLHNGLRIGFPVAECLTTVLEVGLGCSEESPRNRLGMSEVVRELISIKERFFKARRGARVSTSLRVLALPPLTQAFITSLGEEVVDGGEAQNRAWTSLLREYLSHRQKVLILIGARRRKQAPDSVLYLDISPEIAAERGFTRDERYERVDFQRKVTDFRQTLRDPSWKIIDAGENHGASRDEDSRSGVG